MNTESIESLHSKTFTTPNLATSLVLIVAILLISYPIFRFKLVYSCVVAFILLALYKPLLKMHMNFKRIAFFVAFLLLSILLLDAITYALRNRCASAVFLSFILLIVLYFASERDIKVVIPLSVLFSTAITSLSAINLVSSLIGVLIGLIYLKYVDKDIRGFNVREYFKAFLLSWLSNSPRYFEDVLKKKATTFRGWVKCIAFGDVKLVSTSFHPGPMRNIGGARLVEKVISLGNAIYLHSPTGHELNPVSFEEVVKIVGAVKCSDVTLKPMKPFDLESDNYILRVFPFDRVRLMFFIGKNCLDDLPYELNEYAEKFGEAIVVDSHNAHCRDFKPRLDELRSLIRRAFEVRTDYCNVEYYYKSYPVETETICGVVEVLLLKYHKQKHLILMIDGNNIDLNFRKRIEEFCRKWGYIATVISTDNHSKTGIQAKIGYKPIGLDEKDEVVFKLLEDCFKSAEFRSCEITYSKRFVDVRVTGRDFCVFVSEVGSFGFKALRLFLALLVSTALLSIILA
jgi:putative membrane protein